MRPGNETGCAMTERLAPGSRTRIAVITTSFPTHADDAAGHFVASELRQLVPARLRVFAPWPGARANGAPRLERRIIDGHPVEVQWLAGGDAFGWPGLAARLREDRFRALGATQFVASARRQVRAFAPERVIAHWALPSAWPIAPRGTALDIVSHGGDVRLLAALPRPLRARLVRRLLAHARSWRFVSESLREELACSLDEALAASLRAFATVQAPLLSCAVDDTKAAALRASVPAGPVFVAVGRLVPTKRVDRIVEHLAAHAPAATLVVVGDGPERTPLERLAERARLRTHFVGERPRSEALAWIRAADWLCFASECEGASCVLSEAQALGTPVLAVPLG